MMKIQKSILVLMSAVMLMGCGSSSSETPAEQPEEEAPAETAKPAAAPAAAKTPAPDSRYSGFETGQTVYDDNNILITLAEIEDDGRSTNVYLDIENNTDTTVRVNVKAGYFDNCIAERHTYRGNDFAPGDKDTNEACFYNRYFKFYMEDAPQMIDLDLEIWDLDGNTVIDRCTASLKSKKAADAVDPSAYMTLLAEISDPHTVQFYQAGADEMILQVCSVPFSAPGHSHALLSVLVKPELTFIHPSCMGKMDGNYYFVLYFEEPTDQSHYYYASNIMVNGEPFEQTYTCMSFPGRGNFLVVGIPKDMAPEDVTSLTFSLYCDNGTPVQVEWPL